MKELKASRVIHLRFLFLLFFSIVPLIGNTASIGIFTYQVKGMHPWDPDSIRSGITGSEEAVIYLSQELCKLGHRVVVVGSPPIGSVHSSPKANPRFLQDHEIENQKFDAAISWRMPYDAKRLKFYAKKVYFWPHDTPPNGILAEQAEGFDEVFWLSAWQREEWVRECPAFAKFKNIYGNGIVPSQFGKVRPRENLHSCIYGSNYGRGLEILLDIWPNIRKHYPEATLDIYYGWEHWSLLSPEKEAKMRRQVEKLKPLGVTDHGLVGHDELNRAYEKASFWTYPCIAPETFCITALRAQFAGAIPVVIEGSALSQTVPFGYKCSSAAEYESLLFKSMKEVDHISLDERRKMREFILRRYTWEGLAKKWSAAMPSVDN